MLRLIALGLICAALVVGVLAAPSEVGFAAAPQDSIARPEDQKQKLTPEQLMSQRYPQPVKVGFLVGLPVLDENDSTFGYIREVVRTPEGKVLLVVPYRGWFGWAPTSWGQRSVGVPIETVAILGQQVAALDFSRKDFAAAPSYMGEGKPLSPNETIRIALYRR